MVWKNSLQSLGILSILLSLELGFTFGNLQQVNAQPVSKTGKTVEQTIPSTQINFQPPDDQGAPRGSSTTGNRDETIDPPDKLNLLLPNTNGLLGLTLKEHPTFFISISDPSIQKAEFYLIDKQSDKITYQTTVSLSGNPGIVSISIPSDVTPLEPEKIYTWMVAAYSNQNSVPIDLITGEIQRVERPDLNIKLETANPLDQAVLYAQNGIWFDTLETLAELKRLQPNNLTIANEWTELLKSVGLDKISTQPLI